MYRADLSPWSALAMTLASSTSLHTRIHMLRCYTIHTARRKRFNQLYPWVAVQSGSRLHRERTACFSAGTPACGSLVAGEASKASKAYAA